MKSDLKALLKVFGWSFVVAVLIIGVGVAGALGWLTREATIKLMVCCLIAGGALIGQRYGRALVQRDARKDKPAGPPATSDGGVSPPPGA
jgi:hypothetical protein